MKLIEDSKGLHFFRLLLSSEVKPDEQKLLIKIKRNLEDSYAGYAAFAPTNLIGFPAVKLLSNIVDLVGSAQTKNELLFYTSFLEQVLQLLGSRHTDVLGIDEFTANLSAKIRTLRSNGKKNAFEKFKTAVNPVLDAFKTRLGEFSKNFAAEKKECLQKIKSTKGSLEQKKWIDLKIRLELSQQKIQQLMNQVDVMKKDVLIETGVVDKITADIKKLQNIAVAKTAGAGDQVDVEQVDNISLLTCQRDLLVFFELRYSQLPALNTDQEDILTAVGALLGVVGPLGELGEAINLIISTTDRLFSAAEFAKSVEPYLEKHEERRALLGLGIGGVAICAVLFPPSIPVFIAILEVLGFGGLSKDLLSTMHQLKQSISRKSYLDEISTEMPLFFKAVKADREQFSSQDIFSNARLLTAGLADETIARIAEVRESLIATLNQSGINGTAFDRVLFKGDNSTAVYVVLAALLADKSVAELVKHLVLLIEAAPQSRVELMSESAGKVNERLVDHFTGKLSQAVREMNYRKDVLPPTSTFSFTV